MSPATTLPRTLDEGTSRVARRGPALFRALCATRVDAPGARHALAGLSGVELGRGPATTSRRGARDDGDRKSVV